MQNGFLNITLILEYIIKIKDLEQGKKVLVRLSGVFKKKKTPESLTRTRL